MRPSLLPIAALALFLVLATLAAAQQSTPAEARECKAWLFRRVAEQEQTGPLTIEEQVRRAAEDANGKSARCRDVLARDRPTPPARAPLSSEDANALMNGAIERYGAPGAKCEKKQYGSGWVVVCE